MLGGLRDMLLTNKQVKLTDSLKESQGRSKGDEEIDVQNLLNFI